jgi:hypothetical protein
MSASEQRDAAETPLRLVQPASLRRVGPARLLVEEQSGLGAPMGRSGYYLRHGRLYFLRVCPPRAVEGGQAVAEVTAEGGELLPISRPLKITSGPDAGIAYSFSPRLRRLLPARTQLMVTLAWPGADLFTLTLPVVILPSLRRQLIGAVSLFFTVASTRYLALIRDTEAAPVASLVRIATDFWFLFETTAVALGLLLGLRVASRLWLVWGGSDE